MDETLEKARSFIASLSGPINSECLLYQVWFLLNVCNPTQQHQPAMLWTLWHMALFQLDLQNFFPWTVLGGWCDIPYEYRTFMLFQKPLVVLMAALSSQGDLWNQKLWHSGHNKTLQSTPGGLGQQCKLDQNCNENYSLPWYYPHWGLEFPNRWHTAGKTHSEHDMK